MIEVDVKERDGFFVSFGEWNDAEYAFWRKYLEYCVEINGADYELVEVELSSDSQFYELVLNPWLNELGRGDREHQIRMRIDDVKTVHVH